MLLPERMDLNYIVDYGAIERMSTAIERAAVPPLSACPTGSAAAMWDRAWRTL